tara:strand:- start:239 stop:1162 length:924 start_codon:yes stop_codon:yes gene_type:complete
MRCQSQVVFIQPIMKKWLVIQRDFGQLGNRLHTHANALAWCIENKVNLINFSFKKYSPWFSSKKTVSVEIFISHKSKRANLLRYERLWKFLERICRSDKWLNRLTNIAVKEKDDSEFLSETELSNSFESEAKALLVRAWDLRCPHSLEMQQERVREILTPNDSAKDSANKSISQLRERFDCVVGVHARRGDYEKHLGGIHFHSWDSYRDWIIQTKNLLQIKGKGRVGFLLCSDDNPDYSTFDDLPVSFGDSKSVITDLHSLSLCDYNLGPPSSFGTWLSWHGQVPRFQVGRDAIIESIDQFSICSEC